MRVIESDLCTSPAPAQASGGRLWHPRRVVWGTMATLAALLLSTTAWAQGDVLGSNRDRPVPSETRGSSTHQRSVPDRAYVPDASRPQRRVRLLGEDVVYRLERPGQAQLVYRDMDAIPVVVCARPPCDVLLPEPVTLAVQARGEQFARGQLRVPPGPGTLEARIAGNGRRRIAGAFNLGSALAASGVLFGYGGAEDPDAFFSLRPVFFGIGAGVLISGLVVSLFYFLSPRKGLAWWNGRRPLALSRHSL